MITSKVLKFGTVSVIIAQKNTGAYYILALSHSILLGTTVLEARPKVQEQDRGRSIVIRPRCQTPRLVEAVTWITVSNTELLSPTLSEKNNSVVKHWGEQFNGVI